MRRAQGHDYKPLNFTTMLFHEVGAWHQSVFISCYYYHRLVIYAFCIIGGETIQSNAPNIFSGLLLNFHLQYDFGKSPFQVLEQWHA